jgi:hypothetical protein
MKSVVIAEASSAVCWKRVKHSIPFLKRGTNMVLEMGQCGVQLPFVRFPFFLRQAGLSESAAIFNDVVTLFKNFPEMHFQSLTRGIPQERVVNFSRHCYVLLSFLFLPTLFIVQKMGHLSKVLYLRYDSESVEVAFVLLDL